jgi:hypothetical protein
MNRLLAALIVGAFAFASGSVLAQATEKPKPETQPLRGLAVPLKQMDVEQAKAAHEAAKEAWDKMTPEEQAAWKKKARAKRVADLNAIEEYAVEQGAVYDTEAAKKAAEQSKAMPKPSSAERQKAMQQQSKSVKGQ